MLTWIGSKWKRHASANALSIKRFQWHQNWNGYAKHFASSPERAIWQTFEESKSPAWWGLENNIISGDNWSYAQLTIFNINIVVNTNTHLYHSINYELLSVKDDVLPIIPRPKKKQFATSLPPITCINCPIN